jgi:hypothetical protein
MEASSEQETPLDLLYPFYLDADMSMAFAAVLAGGVSLEQEEMERVTGASQAVRNLRGNLRLWRLGGIDAGTEQKESADATNELRLVRRHTVASIFIDLYDELRRKGRIQESPAFDDLREGDLVSMRLGPAVAPLLRVVDQLIRLLDVMVPVVEPESESSAATGGKSKHQRRPGGPGSRSPAPQEQDEGLQSLRQLRGLFVALREDLDHSGLIDIVVASEGEPGAILTLDKRFVSAPTLELLHTSQFTVVGKVTQVWRKDDDVVPLYRRSVLSLIPALGSAIAWNVLMLLGTIAKSLDVKELERSAWLAFGMTPPEAPTVPEVPTALPRAAEAPPGETETGEPSAQGAEDIRFGDDVAALNPAVLGRAFQILPLAICS